MKKESLTAFNDGVIAIIVTLMVLDIHPTGLSGPDVRSLLWHIGAYAVSFVVTAIFWLNVHTLLDPLKDVSALGVWMNLLLLFFLSLTPLPTEALGRTPASPAAHVFFAAVMFLAAVAYALLHWTVDAQLTYSTPAARLFLHIKNGASTALFAAAMPLALVSVWISGGIFVLVPALYFVPTAHLKREPDGTAGKDASAGDDVGPR